MKDSRTKFHLLYELVDAGKSKYKGKFIQHEEVKVRRSSREVGKTLQEMRKDGISKICKQVL